MIKPVSGSLSDTCTCSSSVILYPIELPNSVERGHTVQKGNIHVQWAHRVKLGQISRLYDLAKLGIYDNELLLEVGWGLYARCQSVLTVINAINKGELPCPQCEQIVYRPVKHTQYLERRAKAINYSEPRFSCPICKQELTWSDCQEALCSHPKCFIRACQQPLDLCYSEDKLRCNGCGREWMRLDYERSVRRRKWLPCPHCGSIIRRPDRIKQDAHAADESAKTPASGKYPCPSCHCSSGTHTSGKFLCLQCGHEQSWKSYRRRTEHLKCASCGHQFTWKSWRQQYRGQNLFVGNIPAVEEFLSKWPQCRTPQKQLTQIDTLLHALHGRGAIAPAFLAGNVDTVMKLLDRLAQQR